MSLTLTLTCALRDILRGDIRSTESGAFDLRRVKLQRILSHHKILVELVEKNLQSSSISSPSFNRKFGRKVDLLQIWLNVDAKYHVVQACNLCIKSEHLKKHGVSDIRGGIPRRGKAEESGEAFAALRQVAPPESFALQT